MRIVRTYTTNNRKRSLKKVLDVLSKYSSMSQRELISEHALVNKRIADAYHRYNIKTCCRIHKQLYLEKRTIETTLEEKFGYESYYLNVF